MSTSAIKLGEAFVKIGANATELNSTIQNATGKIKNFGEQACNVANAVAIGWGVMQAAVVAVTKHFSSVGDQLDKMSIRTGVSATTLSKWAFVASQCGTSIEAIEKSLRPMQRSIVAGSSSFAELGINLENLSALKTEDQFYVLSQSISSIDNPAQRAAMAMEVFDKSGTEHLPLFAAGADGMQKMDTMADELVLTMNQSAVTAFLPDDKKE